MENAQLAMPGAPGLVVVEGTISRVTFANEERGFAIVRLDCDGRTEIVKGTLGRVNVGDGLRIEGRRKRDPKWGDQIEATKVIPIAPTSIDGVARYLAELPGLGDVSARKIVGRHGERSIAMLIADPAAVARACGVPRRNCLKAAEAAKEKRDEQEVLVWLYSIGLSPAFAGRVLREWGAKAPTIIRANPYRLTRIAMIGFALADQIARNLGIPPDAIERREAGVLHVLGEAASSGVQYDQGGRKVSTGGGHCFLPRGLLGEVAAQILTVSREAVDEAIGTLADQGEIVIEESAVYGRQLHRAEFEVAERVGVLARNRRAPPPSPEAGSPAARALEPLTAEQRAAVGLTREAAVVVMTGGPGTGKSFTLRAVVALWEQAKSTVLLCAPTGRAAKRLAESTGRSASTIHRLLEWKGEEGFQRNRQMPLVCDLVVVDEASMLDAPLAKHLLAAIPQGASLLLVGDVDQLPSVGPGQVLHDVIASGVVPVARLSRIFRQAEGSEISSAARAVLDGHAPCGTGGELAVVPIQDGDEQESAGQSAQREIVRLVVEQMPRQGFAPRDVQVLVPMHKGAAGTRELNRALQAALNPCGAELKRGGDRPPFRVGDPVLQTKNDYDLGVMNGDLGRIVGVDPSVPSVTSNFDGNEVVHEKDAISQLELAYAMSIHKSQGSEYPAVVMTLLMEHWIMLRRNLLYTGMTRGKRRVVIVGQEKALAIAARTRDTSTRYTGLRARLAANLAAPAPTAARPTAAAATATATAATARATPTAAATPAPAPPATTATTATMPPARRPAPASHQRREAAQQAVQLLAGRCDGAHSLDGAGFSKFDSARGHALADLDRPFTDAETWEAARLARRYQRQIGPELRAALGIREEPSARTTARAR